MRRPKIVLTADQVLTRKAMAWATKIRVNPTQVVITDLETKWGSCAPDGVITLAGDLVDMPDNFQDYVVVHELLHLRYRSHGKAFAAMMTALVPTWRELEASSTVSERRP
ncbi:M48 family metallopeptidase [Microbacterium sp. LWH3-1.2]|uniref:M48 metallopeptidase family protein n=1 Tax=Microbacterium sp. LWH3-1.2 TaxID=3135256 RepID=UPI00342799F5